MLSSGQGHSTEVCYGLKEELGERFSSQGLLSPYQQLGLVLNWNEGDGPGSQETPGMKTGPESAGGLKDGPLDRRVFSHQKICNNLHTLKDKCASLSSLSRIKEHCSATKGAFRAFVQML